MIVRCIFAAVLLIPIAGHAQVYKCQEGGRTVYSQEPCSHRAEVIDATPASGRYDHAAAIERRTQTARIELQNKVGDIERDANRRIANRQREAEQASKQAKCDQIRRKKESADYWSKEFRHPDNIRREQDAAKQAGSELWGECR